MLSTFRWLVGNAMTAFRRGNIGSFRRGNIGSTFQNPRWLLAVGSFDCIERFAETRKVPTVLFLLCYMSD